ncbi:unnamed protein product [Brassica oleracea]
MIEVWSCPTLSCIASFLIHITNYKTAPFSAPLFSVLLYVYNVNIPAKFEARPTLRLQYCPLRIKRSKLSKKTELPIKAEAAQTHLFSRNMNLPNSPPKFFFFIGLQVKEMAGFVYNPITGRWLLSDDIGVNFI